MRNNGPSSSESLSFEISSQNEELFSNRTACHVKRPSIVPFRDPNSTGLVESLQVRPKIERVGKKAGSCYACGKGNRFTQKEVCIVCGAKYCCKCLVRAMGSMSQGRKCVSCIGHWIDESRRKNLGKSSRMLKRVFTKFEVEKIMKSEISCEVNQIPGDLIFVNGEPLSQEEIVKLQSSQNSPRKLRRGSYWYDNFSGYWGKEGQKPCQIISPNLNVGGILKPNASNGNTDIFINNREITKVELLILQIAGVPCEGKLHYWVNSDGSFQEEGMNNVIDKIWDKTVTKLLCSLLSFPYPTCSRKKMLNKLLVGPHKSGASNDESAS